MSWCRKYGCGWDCRSSNRSATPTRSRIWASSPPSRALPTPTWLCSARDNAGCSWARPPREPPCWPTCPCLFPSSRYRSEARLAAGKQYFLTGKLSEALQALEPLARARERESTEAAYWLARAMLKTNRSQEALALLENVLQTRPEGGAAVYLELARADALNELPGRRKEAATAYEKFAAQHPDHPLSGQALSLAASASFDDRDFAAARRQADSFLDNPRLANHELTPSVLCLGRGELSGRSGEMPPGQSVTIANSSADFRPAVTPVRHFTSWPNCASGRSTTTKRSTLFEKCRQQFPQGEYAVRAQYGLAAASFGRGDTGSAAAALEKVFAANPDAARPPGPGFSGDWSCNGNSSSMVQSKIWKRS